ncbi:hypothetical protein HPB48_008092 [Haemaphysalis longicornis]|uniref:Uncharacterized protein n=1 Tax=Haemaphysalis longicornis TaxID=44386 RepID=A0A9J6GYD9_HAELO|nr:hypothetical protein HPB48_008092 [Haemaphysalis longicornis]
MDHSSLSSSPRFAHSNWWRFECCSYSFGLHQAHKKGVLIEGAMEAVHIELQNEVGTLTRLADHAKHTDSSPDVTWTSTALKCDWHTWPDAHCSDHFAIAMKLKCLKGRRQSRQAYVMRWDKFKRLFTNSIG